MKNQLKADSILGFINDRFKQKFEIDDTKSYYRKEFINNSLSTIDEVNKSFECVISTINIDRSADSVVPSGLDFSDFKNIPSVFRDHNYTLPVGRCDEITVYEDKVVAKVYLDANTEATKECFELVKSGVLKGVSIGFVPTSVVTPYDKNFETLCKTLKIDSKICKRIITSAKVYEFSLVGIPANPECTVKNFKPVENEVDIQKDVQIVEKPVEKRYFNVIKRADNEKIVSEIVQRAINKKFGRLY
jgi:HK97 family phage prohead protease